MMRYRGHKNNRLIGCIAYQRNSFNQWIYLCKTITKKENKIELNGLYLFKVEFSQGWFVPSLVEIDLVVGSGDEDFPISSMYYRYLVIIFP